MWYAARRRYARLGIDLVWVALSAVLALLIRDNLGLSVKRLAELSVYAPLCVVSAAIVFSGARLNKGSWRYISLAEIFSLVAAVTIALLLALLGTFILSRLEGVARTLPLIQWFLLIFLMVGSRVAVRLIGERSDRKRRSSSDVPTPREHVLVVGGGDLAELYLRAAIEFVPSSVVIVGLLAAREELRGRLLRMQKVLGEPKDVEQVIRQFDVHGVAVDRIVVAEPFEQLSKDAKEALRAVERATAIKVDWLIEMLGLRRENVPDGPDLLKSVSERMETEPQTAAKDQDISPGRYHHLKRVIDVAAALALTVALVPVVFFAALLVAIDVGFPLVFWQQRPGRYGQVFKIYKFCTMHSAHDADGNRISDELRSSRIGRFLRRSRLDELPQLYNILVGEMSFVGPRPLLPLDQPKGHTARLLVRPGLTGWAQVNGGRDLSPNDKAELDEWYIVNASFWLDIKILLRTFATMILGDKSNALTPQAMRGQRMSPGARVPVAETLGTIDEVQRSLSKRF